MKGLTLNEVGFPVLNQDLHDRIFGNVPKPQPKNHQVSRSRRGMDKANVPNPVDYPDNIYTGDLPLPKLKGDDIFEHFEKIAEEQVGEYVELAEQFAKAELFEPPVGDAIRYEAGWTRYEPNGDGWTVTNEAPKEKAFTYDTETFVEGGNFPIIATCMSEKAFYLWLAKELLDPNVPETEWDQHNLVPLPTDNFVAGHNVSFDRVRAACAYTLDRNKPENFYFDTLSGHVATAGLASGQRWLYTLTNKDPELLTEEEKSKLRYRPRWVEEGATNSLVAAYNFHVYEPRKYFGENAKPLDEGDKKVREIFVIAKSLWDINSVLEAAVEYALKDAFYTAELFQSIWPKYRECSPSWVHLAGHYHLNASRVPVTNDWYEWIKHTESVFESHQNEVTEISTKIIHTTYQKWRKLTEENPEEAQKWVNEDPWNCQLDWEVKTNRGKYAGVPNWYRPFAKDPNNRVTTKSKILHLLMRLKWEGQPIEWVDGMAWCYHEKGEIKRIPHPEGDDKNVGGLITKEFIKDAEVGRLSSDVPEAKRVLEISNAVSYWTGMRKRVRERIIAKVPNPHGEDALLMAPSIVVHGTVTRRTVEPVLVGMCSTKPWRIGTELKTRLAAPDGWKIVMADFDAQEMSMASIYADAWEGGYIGASPFTYSILSGSKEKGSDSHTLLSRAIFKDEYEGITWEHGKMLYNGGPLDSEKKQLLGLCRDVSKSTNFALLYGAGVRTISTYIGKSFPSKTESETRQFAKIALSSKKGIKNQEGYYEGGSDSGAYNMMVKLALKSKVPTLPSLGTRISNALRPAVVGNDFLTARTNYTIQAAGSDMLAIILTASYWLADEFKIPAQFAVSIHDEISWIVPEKQAKMWAAVFQLAHVYSWARFQAGCGVNDLPLSRAFFSSVAVDDRVRKSPYESTVTLSNEAGKDEPNGEEYTINDLAEDGTLKKLATRLELISKGMI